MHRAGARESPERSDVHDLLDAGSQLVALAFEATQVDEQAGQERQRRLHVVAAGGEVFDEAALALDARNPQVAARLLGAFKSWQTLEPGRRQAAERALRRVAATDGLSPDVRDIVERSLA